MFGQVKNRHSIIPVVPTRAFLLLVLSLIIHLINRLAWYVLDNIALLPIAATCIASNNEPPSICMHHCAEVNCSEIDHLHHFFACYILMFVTNNAIAFVEQNTIDMLRGQTDRQTNRRTGSMKLRISPMFFSADIKAVDRGQWGLTSRALLGVANQSDGAAACTALYDSSSSALCRG
jgi:hypothetical protein